MYKVLLADDESIICEGLSRLIRWEALGLSLTGTAADGLEAYQKIRKDPPDILITDIRMPGLDGLSLLEKVSAEFPHMKCVILSGYGEFDFANRAMSHGVKHYLLKPCDEKDVEKVLREVTAELDEDARSRDFLAQTVEQLREAIPAVKESFFREAVLAHFFDRESLLNYKALFNIRETSFLLVVLVPDGKVDYVGKFSLKKIAEELFGEETVCISTVMQEEVCFLISSRPVEKVIGALKQVRDYYQKYYGVTLSASISEPGPFEEIGTMYSQAEYCLGQRFYLGGNAIILQSDVPRQVEKEPFHFDRKPLLSAVENGDTESLNKELERFFSDMALQHLPEQALITRCMELFMEVISLGRPEEMMEYVGDMLKIRDVQNTVQLFELLSNTIRRIAQKNHSYIQERRNSLVRQVVECVDKNFGNPQISLSWIAGQILYVNSDYLGRLFYRETGEYFSQYLLRCRMEAAKRLIRESSENVKIYEIAARVGLEENPQYFSQLFKKYTGMTPKVYQKQAKETS